MKFLALVMSMFLVSCGFSSMNNEVIGQVKRVTNATPILCMNYADLDLSLGVMRGGVGSMSTQDIDLWIEKADDVATLKKAAEQGKLVKIIYNFRRWNWCVPLREIVSVTILDN